VPPVLYKARLVIHIYRMCTTRISGSRNHQPSVLPLNSNPLNFFEKDIGISGSRNHQPSVLPLNSNPLNFFIFLCCSGISASRNHQPSVLPLNSNPLNVFWKGSRDLGISESPTQRITSQLKSAEFLFFCVARDCWNAGMLGFKGYTHMKIVYIVSVYLGIYVL